jgi:hypothetical protein
MVPVLESTDLRNKLEDLSGVVFRPGENPYNALIETCHDDPVESPLSHQDLKRVNEYRLTEDSIYFEKG